MKKRRLLLTSENKTNFILRKRHLSLRELSAQTGLTEEEVSEVLKGKESLLHPAPPVISLEGRGVFWFGSGLLVFLVGLFYLPVWGNDFVNWDDKGAILENVEIRSLNASNIKWMFTTFATGNWMPLTWLSFALDYHMGGLNPRVFHATNLLFHAINTLLVFWLCVRFLKRIPGRGDIPFSRHAGAFVLPIAFLTAVFFGLHPIHVESVAWATERKDVLYSFFYLWGIYLYLDYSKDPLGKKGKLWACFGLYILSMMSKPMAVTLPFVFLILDFWPLERFQRGYQVLLREKIPFFFLAFLSVLVTMASHAKTMSYEQNGVEFYWALNAVRTPAFYLWKMIFPVGLSAYYPFPPEITPFYLIQNFLGGGLVIALSVLCFRLQKKAPYLLASWFFFLVALLPVLGFIQTGTQAAADRYTYLPSLGIFLLLSAGAARLVSHNLLRFGGVSLAAAAGLGFLTMGQIGTWKNTEVLWENVTRNYPDENSDAYARLGAAYLKSRRFDDALTAFSRAVSIPPAMGRTYHGLGTALMYKDRIPEAIQVLDYALTLDPKMTGPRLNLWNVFERQGKHGEAIQQMMEALKVEPNSAVFYNNLGVSWGFLKKNQEAWKAFDRAHRLDHDNSEYLVNLATVDLWEGRWEKSLAWYEKGIARQPREPVYFLKMADIYIARGKKVMALDKLRKGWGLNPQNTKVIQQMGEDFEAIGQTALAQECFAKLKTLSAGKNTSH